MYGLVAYSIDPVSQHDVYLLCMLVTVFFVA